MTYSDGDRMTDPTQNPEGLWSALEAAELSALQLVTGQLKPFRSPVCDCYEAGVQSQCLPGERRSAPDLRVAALYLKRVLMDLRATWLLCLRGYTAQAASVAASLYENALATEVIAGTAALASRCVEEQGKGLPWSVLRLTELRVAKREALAKQRGETYTDEQRLSAGEITYFGYRWLCKMKHPTIPALLHEASGTKVDARTFVIMALPSANEADLILKGLILTGAVLEAKAAICAFADGGAPDTSSAAYTSFADRIGRVTPQLSLAFHEVCTEPPPFLLEQHGYTIRALKDPFG
jgi:hypothetical protein